MRRFRIAKRVGITAVALAAALLLFFFILDNPLSVPIVRNFEECKNAGFPVLETVPRRCEVAKGRYIVEVPLTDCRTIDFAQFPAKEAYEGDPAPINFSTYPDAANMKTTMESRMREGVNFAGRYNLMSWGCGTSCEEHALVDVKTGNIIVYGFPSSYGAEFRKDSGLLVLNPKERIPSHLTPEEEKSLATEYYLFEHSGFVRLCASPAGSTK